MFQRFCNMFSESSPRQLGRTAAAMLPKQGRGTSRKHVKKPFTQPAAPDCSLNVFCIPRPLPRSRSGQFTTAVEVMVVCLKERLKLTRNGSSIFESSDDTFCYESVGTTSRVTRAYERLLVVGKWPFSHSVLHFTKPTSGTSLPTKSFNRFHKGPTPRH